MPAEPSALRGPPDPLALRQPAASSRDLLVLLVPLLGVLFPR